MGGRKGGRVVCGVVAALAASVVVSACVPVAAPSPPPPPPPPACAGRTLSIIGDSIVAFGTDRIRSELAARGVCVVQLDAQSGRTIGEHQGLEAALSTPADAVVFSFGTNEAREIAVDLILTQDQARTAFRGLLDRVAPETCVRFLSLQEVALGVAPGFREQLAWYNAMVRAETREGYAVAEIGPRIDANLVAWWPLEFWLPDEQRTHVWVHGPEIPFGGQFHLVEDRAGISALVDVIAESLASCGSPTVPDTTTSTVPSSTVAPSPSTSEPTTTSTTDPPPEGP